jgi:hypothetical protein
MVDIIIIIIIIAIMYLSLAAKGVGELGDGPVPRVPHTCTCMYTNCQVSYTVAVFSLMCDRLPETDSNEEEIESVFYKTVCKRYTEMPSTQRYIGQKLEKKWE